MITNDVELRREAGEYPTALVLNADYLPLSYAPLELWCWQDTIKAITEKKAVPVSFYDGIYIRSPSIQMQLPSVIMLTRYVRRCQKVAFTRYNIHLRDEFQCQYCGAHTELTYDHLVPRARGGQTSWENIVIACSPCNGKKGQLPLKDSGLKLKRQPFEPVREQLEAIAKRYPPNHLHDDWRSEAWWDAELEP